jgi:putative ABC transport system permease protein
MKLSKSFKIALNIIMHSKLRSWLTIIGIVIGIAAILSIVSLGQGAQRTIEQNLNSLNANIITISPGFSRASGAGAEFRGGFGGGPEGGGSRSSSTKGPKNLTVKDVTMIRGISNVVYVMGTVSGSISVSYIGKSSRVSIQGVDPSVWKFVDTTAISSGRTFSQGDVGVIIVGGNVANSTFSGMEINRQVEIGNKSFKIIGVLATSGGSDDNRIFMPISDAITVLDGKDAKDFDSITVEIKDISLTDDTVNQITKTLMLSHSILSNQRQDFSITSLKSIQQRISSTLGSVQIFLTAIAAISLIVGAIGIMNSMFTSVLEKTKEIGILKALGAKNRDILMIFLFNSGIIGLIGGIIGVLLGIFASGYIGQLAGGSTIGRGPFGSSYVSTSLIIEVFALAIGVGLISGVVPAYSASRLKPVDALRYE